METRKRFNIKSLVIVLIFIIGFYLRICHVNHGAHYIFNHDGQHFIEQALRYGKGTLKPLGLLLHGPFLSYVLFFEYVFYFLVNFLIGKMANSADLIKEYILNPSLFFMLGGLTIAFFSMGILFLTYFICRKFFNRKTGLIAVFFTSVSFYMVYVSHCIKEDIVAGFFILLSFYFALKALSKSQHFLRLLYISALFIGVAISVKYYSFIGFFIIILVLAIKIKKEEIKPAIFLKFFLKCIFITVGIFLILNPYSLICFKEFIGGLTAMGKYHSTVSLDLYDRPSWLLYFLFLKEGIGAPIFYLYLSSLVLIFSNRKILLCNIYPIFLYVFLSFFKCAKPFYLPSVIPFVLISSAFLMASLLEFFIKKKRVLYIATFFVTILFSLSTLVVSWKFCSLLNKDDTRKLSKKWVESNIKEDSSILIEGAYTFNIIGSPQLIDNIATLERESNEIKKLGGSGFLWGYKMKYATLQKNPAYNLYKVTMISQEDIKKYKTEYIIFNSYNRPPVCSQINGEKDYLKGRYICIKKILPDVNIEFFPSFESLYNNAFKGIDKINFKSLSTLKSYGPVIEIYKRIE